MKISLFFILLVLVGCSNLIERYPSASQTCLELMGSFHGIVANRFNGDLPGTGIQEVKGADLILVNDSLRDEVERVRALYNRSIERGGDLELITSKLGLAKKRLGKGIVNKTLSDSAISMDQIIITRNMNSGANSYIGHRGVMKPSFIKAKTAKYGLIKGLIPYDQSLVARDLPQDLVETYKGYVAQVMATGTVNKVILETPEGTAVIRNGSQMFVEEVLPSDKIIYVLGDSNGFKYTADVDLYALGGKKPDESASFFSEELGTTTEKEVESIKKINEIFTFHDTHRNTDRDLVLHGSEIHNPNPVNLDFPLRVYLPDGRVFDVDEGPSRDPQRYLNALKAWGKSHGYHINGPAH